MVKNNKNVLPTKISAEVTLNFNPLGVKNIVDSIIPLLEILILNKITLRLQINSTHCHIPKTQFQIISIAVLYESAKIFLI